MKENLMKKLQIEIVRERLLFMNQCKRIKNESFESLKTAF